MRRAFPLTPSFALSATGADVPRGSFALSAPVAGAPRRIVFLSPDLTETLYGVGDFHAILATVVNCEGEGLEPSEPPDPDVSRRSAPARESAAREKMPT